MKTAIASVALSVVFAAIVLGPVITYAYNGVMHAFKFLGVGLP